MAGECAWQSGMYGRGHAWQGECMAGGACVAKGGMCGGGGGVCMPCMPPRHYKIRSVNARAVRILLECILVFLTFVKNGSMQSQCFVHT